MGRAPRNVLFLLLLPFVLVLAAACSSGESPSTQDVGSPAGGASPTTPTTPPTTSGGGVTTPGEPATGPTASTSPVPPPSNRVPAGTVTVVRTGGFAGVRQQLTVNPDGRWLYTSARGGNDGGQPRAGKLPAAQLSQLRELLARPALREEAQASYGPGKCRDGFFYVLNTPVGTVTWVGCGFQEPPTAAGIVTLLARQTPL